MEDKDPVLYWAVLGSISASAFLVATLAFATPAHASPACALELGRVKYVATFEWERRSGDAQVLKLELGTRGGARPQLAARILDARTGSCQAVCRARLQAGKVVDLSCQDADLGALSTRATILSSVNGSKRPIIRFGTWLNGYREARLEVQKDRI